MHELRVESEVKHQRERADGLAEGIGDELQEPAGGDLGRARERHQALHISDIQGIALRALLFANRQDLASKDFKPHDPTLIDSSAAKKPDARPVKRSLVLTIDQVRTR